MSEYINASKSKIEREIKNLIANDKTKSTLSDFRDHTDPKYTGPGTWNLLHRVSFKARNRQQQLSFIELTKETCYGFSCGTCKGHCTEYIKNHPLEEYLDVLVDINGELIAIGMFVWTWKFHNAVNARIGKPIMSWETAYNLYSDTEVLVCSKNCMEAGAVNALPDGLEHAPNQVPKIPEFNINTQQLRPFRLISVKRGNNLIKK